MEKINLMIEMEKEEYELCKEHYQMGTTVSFATKLIANGKPVMKLKEAIQLTECISIDYEDADEEEIAQIDDALDIIFRVAREKLKELKKEAEDENN